jgi:proteasome accessory factor A
MLQRLMGLETEFCVRYSPASSTLYRPAKRQVCLAILAALEHVVNTVPGEREGEPHFQRFVQNGGAFSFEVTRIQASDGLLESATPECRGPSQLLLYQRAQEALIQRALEWARVRLAAAGCRGEIAVVKNCRDAKGHVYGTQENYEAEIARGWRLLVYRAGLALLVPGVMLGAAVLFVAVVCATLVTLLILLVFPVARHFVGLDTHSSQSVHSSGDGDLDDIPPALLRALACAGMLVVSPAALLFLLLLRVTAFRAIRSGAMAFLVSRPVVTGAGTVHDDETFGLSERAESTSGTIRSTLRQRNRAIFETANLVRPLILQPGSVVRGVMALFARRQRLQLGVSDSNCAETAEFLKIGTTALVIDMVEAGFLRDAPRVRHAVSAFKRISKDPTLRTRVALTRGDPMTALELQRWYLRRAEEFLAAQRVASLEYREIVTLWRATLQALERDPASLVGRIDWVTKRALMAGAGTLSHGARKKIDIKYHELRSGYFPMLEQKGLAPMRCSAADICTAMFTPPENTPAWQRGQSIKQAGSRRDKMRASWRAS